MLNLLCKIIPSILIALWPMYIHEPNVNEESLCLSELDLSEHIHLNTLLRRIVKEAKGVTNKEVNFLTVDLKDDSCGIRLEVIVHTAKRVFWYDKYDGYAIIDGLPLIFENRSKQVIKEVPNSKGIFPMASRDDPPYYYDPDEWKFILNDDGYARYYEDRGWIWIQNKN